MSAKKVVWVTSFPKSGNTWVHSVLRTAGRDYGFPQVEMDVYNLISKREKPQVCPVIKGGGDETAVLKTHAVYSAPLHPELGLQTAGFCHVIRNPLDVLLSYINFSRLQYGRQKDNREFQHKLFIDLLGFEEIISFENWMRTTIDELPRSALDAALSYFTDHAGEIPTFDRSFTSSWFDHANTWTKARQRYLSVTLRYEDLIQEDAEFLKLVHLFKIPENQILEAVTKINRLKLQDSSDPKRPEDNIFFNKMSSYYYLDYFSKNRIKEFLLKHESQLRLLGYADMPY